MDWLETLFQMLYGVPSVPETPAQKPFWQTLRFLAWAIIIIMILVAIYYVIPNWFSSRPS